MKNVQYIKCLILVALIGLAGCGKLKRPDPLEGINRASYQLNKAVDTVVLRPTALAYEALVPNPIRLMVSNFLNNLNEIPTLANDILQGCFANARITTSRLILNSLWGIGGLLDVAGTCSTMERHKSDFGQTLARWGYCHSLYIVVPFFGPSTIRDGIGTIATYFMGIPPYLHSVALRNGIFIVNTIDNRTQLLKADAAIQEAVDEYIFVRDAYLQLRQQQISRGQNTTEPEKGELLEPPE